MPSDPKPKPREVLRDCPRCGCKIKRNKRHCSPCSDLVRREYRNERQKKA